MLYGAFNFRAAEFVVVHHQQAVEEIADMAVTGAFAPIVAIQHFDDF